ncbi:alginate O-acetyltransferase complex protein AlgI [Halolactibacillus halophilus]|uniref:Alginate O-acetyltransferase complex protein AlgI n=1 Tax=Halolactibacillus halophilus TaxID=306540 RepID=A0A1I5LZS8_9BACI|nr:MBOAT family O-acyltransferase [Halolactibacillus halophilus]GEM00961.1 alginate regulatory protein [Halolactibacillus halophilus]SFP02720.1 alginate O-acetyltransferase complex protein AlgI [Halolactibacillus halophilus]
MVFSSLTFLLIFLPLALASYIVSPKRLKNGVLLIISLLFYAWGEPVYVFLVIFSGGMDYIHGRLMGRFDERAGLRKLVLLSSLVINLGVLFFFKYVDFIIELINSSFQLDMSYLELPLPIGISFYTFQTLSYTIDVYQKKVTVNHSLIDFLMYVSLFPQLVAGPIVRYEAIDDQLKQRVVTKEDRTDGMFRFSYGLAKKVLISNQMAALYEQLTTIEPISVSVSVFIGLSYGLHIYFDFSGYSDMAIGLGRLFGFRFPENFNYPYQATSIKDFWRRWHITLSQWFRDYLYIPLGGNRVGELKWLRNVVIVWFLTGLWHGASVNFILWGLYFGLFLIAETYISPLVSNKLPVTLKRMYTLGVVLVSWLVFSFTDVNELMRYIKGLVSFDAPPTALFYYLREYALLLVVAIIGSTNVYKRIIMKNPSRAVIVAESLFVMVLVVLSMGYLVDQSFNPFIYFRF